MAQLFCSEKPPLVKELDKYETSVLTMMQMKDCRPSTSPKLERQTEPGDDDPCEHPELYRSAVCSQWVSKTDHQIIADTVITSFAELEQNLGAGAACIRALEAGTGSASRMSGSPAGSGLMLRHRGGSHDPAPVDDCRQL